MENKVPNNELSILIGESLHPIMCLQKSNQTAQCRRTVVDDDENDLPNRNGSHVATARLLQRPSRIDSSYEDCKNSTSASCDSIYDFFGSTTASASSTYNGSRSGNTNSSESFMEEKNETNFSNNADDNEESDNVNLVNYFAFLDDYIRFDVSRTGVSCFSGYSVSIQYEDDFLVGNNVGTVCCNLIWGTSSRIRLWYKDEKAFELEYLPRVSCTRPKDCCYRVKIPDRQTGEIGTIHFQGDLVRVCNAYEKCLSFRRKQGSTCYLIKTDTGERQASVEVFRGFRGDIIYYGLSILGDVSSTDKALLIALTLIMDIRQRESEMRCSFLWVPLFCILVIGIFSILPWIYFYNDSWSF